MESVSPLIVAPSSKSQEKLFTSSSSKSLLSSRSSLASHQHPLGSHSSPRFIVLSPGLDTTGLSVVTEEPALAPDNSHRGCYPPPVPDSHSPNTSLSSSQKSPPRSPPSPHRSSSSPHRVPPHSSPPSPSLSTSSDSTAEIVMTNSVDVVDNGFNKLPTVNSEHISLEQFSRVLVLCCAYIKHKKIVDDYESKLAVLSIFHHSKLSSMLLAVRDELLECEWTDTDSSFLTALKEVVISRNWDSHAGAHLQSFKQGELSFPEYWASLKALNVALKGTAFHLSDEALTVTAQVNMDKFYHELSQGSWCCAFVGMC
ncbi:hypothetical protein VNI00_015956 [Paramarasmius palmivorus]|uniref:Uncharacterized protein n=1 Tax=Paramarasmius palmivorus TaxID=297713 RepID=A0AAW0BIR0_9AGAR